MTGLSFLRNVVAFSRNVPSSFAINWSPASSTVPSAACFSTSSMSATNRGQVAVVLSGCGVFDGTEVHEAAACLAALTRHNLQPVMCAPNVDQAHVVNHSNGEEMKDPRSAFLESARIARGAVVPLGDIKASNKDLKAVVFPGGFGAAKNLSDFAFKGADMTVNAEVSRVLKEFRDAKKPIALCCISPILAAKVFGSQGVKLTLGCMGDEAKWPYGGAIDAAKSFGADVVEKQVDEVCIDEANLLVTTPAFMYAGQFHQIQDGVTEMIKALSNMIKK